jgi:hypothetical protein
MRECFDPTCMCGVESGNRMESQPSRSLSLWGRLWRLGLPTALEVGGAQMKNTVSVHINDVLPRGDRCPVTLTVRLKGVRWYVLKLRLATALIRLGAWVSGFNVKWETK